MFKQKYGLIMNPKKQAQLKKPAAFDDSSDEEDGGKGGVNKLLQREAVKKKNTKQVQEAMAQAMAEDPTVYEYDEVYDKIEDERKKVAAAKLGMGKNKPKYITSLKKAAEQRQREYERVIERKAHKEREEEGDEFDDKEAFVTSSYRKKMEELESDELRLKKEEEFDEKHGIHRQKDLSKFYSNLLKNNISMGAYNVKANTTTATADEGAKDTSSSDAFKQDKDDKKSKHDHDGADQEKRSNLKRLHDDEHHEEERTDNESEQRNETVQEVGPSTQDNHRITEGKMDDSSTTQEKSNKKVEKRNTEETVMAARERYLARKRLKQETQ